MAKKLRGCHALPKKTMAYVEHALKGVVRPNAWPAFLGHMKACGYSFFPTISHTNKLDYVEQSYVKIFDV